MYFQHFEFFFRLKPEKQSAGPGPGGGWALARCHRVSIRKVTQAVLVT